ncbi:serine hydrolase [Xanthobacter agilis]|uniref:CubicO group peptidase (Beta-lactamase class C family) n=1 Tax=Xanthobacter agilis TaxID=47492 RepID=A0ABU0LH94_XANAG|nr:serine hydrolase [Xanthobacter agilis]MDQ0506514.1 CubicO group peptidase (beta-lactamase class C family) [Xanthobacter agilis]
MPPLLRLPPTTSIRWRALLCAGACAAAVLSQPARGAETGLAIDPKLPPSESVALGIPKGQLDAAIAKLDDFATALMKRSGIPGMSVVVVHDGKTVYLKGFGVRKVGAPEAVDADTVFQLASLSKAVGASVVAHQVGAGIVTWDTPVKTLLPWFALKDPWVSAHVTVADLYTHRSGLPDHGGDELEDMGFDRRQILERLKLLPLAPFRITYAYTNFGVTAAAEGVAAASGKDWATLSDAVLYKPLGMSATSSRFADYMAHANRALPHVRENGAFVAKYQRQPDAQSPAGGVSSSARDMGRWLAFVLGNGTFEGKQIVPASALLPAMTAQIVSTPSPITAARPGFYGHGFGVSIAPSGRVVLSHSGAFILGAGTTFAMLPSEKLGIAVLTNAQPVGAAEALAMQFMDYVEFGTITRDWFDAYSRLMAPLYHPLGTLAGLPVPAQPAPAHPLDIYAGTYTNAYYGPATVKVEGDHLVFSIGPKPVVASLGHWSGDTFTFAPAGESAPPGSLSEVTFAITGKTAPTMTAASMTVEFFNENGLGTFTREVPARKTKPSKAVRHK